MATLAQCVVSFNSQGGNVAHSVCMQVTLHNSALFNMDVDATGGFRKLSHLLQSPPFPPPTFCNILMLYCKPQHAFYDLAADIMAENTDLVATGLSKV